MLAFQQRKIEKTYLALVRAGKGSFEKKQGVVDVPLVVNDGWVRTWNRRADKDLEKEKLRDAVTRWEVLGTSVRYLSLLYQTGWKSNIFK